MPASLHDASVVNIGGSSGIGGHRQAVLDAVRDLLGRL